MVHTQFTTTSQIYLPNGIYLLLYSVIYLLNLKCHATELLLPGHLNGVTHFCMFVLNGSVK